MHVNRMVDDLFRISWELSIIVMLGVLDLGAPQNSLRIALFFLLLARDVYESSTLRLMLHIAQ